ncbi:MAG: hypothetical protein M3157_05740 [Actinomycetota bacterium]|nr:hypothetical protein [Actinomycetota bacterium]
MERWISENLVLFLALAGGTLGLLMLIFLGLSILSRGALVEAVVALHGGEERGFSSTWRAGLAHFWRVLGLVLLIFLISLGILLAVGVPAGLASWAVLATAESVGMRVLFVTLVGLLALVVSVLLFVPLYITWQLALRELVVGGEGVAGALRGGYGLFGRSPSRSLLVWLIQVALAIGVGIVVAIVGTICGLLLYGMVVAAGALDSTVATAITTAVALVLFFLVAVAVSGVVGAFFSGYWTLAYLRLRREGDELPVAGSD